MTVAGVRWLALAALVLGARGLEAQAWNAPQALALVRHAVARREAEAGDSGLRDFQARAHGFVLFLGQLGEGFNDPPRLIKADQLESEVYWKAPGASKQVIIGWRDRADLPTDIHYHRDHLGIVQNGFGDRIRIGEGDEVRDVPHPLSAAGDTLYDFAVADSLSIELPQRSIEVYELLVRPRSFAAPRVIGAVYLDRTTAELVRFRFNFTRPAYLDPTLEDITIVLDNGLWNERWWLPRRQEIEIRRRTAVLDLPARGIIRGRWEIGDYRFNIGVPDSLFRGPEIAAAPPAARDSFPWTEPLARALRASADAAPALDLDRVRSQVASLAEGHVITRLATARPAVGALSDIAHFNRVEGLALGGGFMVRPWAATVTASLSYGLSDTRLKGGLSVAVPAGPVSLELRAGRRVRDVGDAPVVSGLVNSLSAQEGAADFGDYFLLDDVTLAVERRWPAGGHVTLSAGLERARDMAVTATPAQGTFRPNPALGDMSYETASVSGDFHGGAVGAASSWDLGFTAVGGRPNDAPWAAGYLRGSLGARLSVPLGESRVTLNGAGGAATEHLPGYRAFMLGGRGTLPGEPFRAYGGRTMAVGRIEWAWPVPFPAFPLGPFGSTGDEAVVAPFFAMGWADNAVAGTPWVPSAGARPVAGVAVELFHRLLRTEVGLGLRTGGVEVSVDVLRDLWPIL